LALVIGQPVSLTGVQTFHSHPEKQSFQTSTYQHHQHSLWYVSP
jgi:hypothetical protein